MSRQRHIKPIRMRHVSILIKKLIKKKNLFFKKIKIQKKKQKTKNKKKKQKQKTKKQGVAGPPPAYGGGCNGLGLAFEPPLDLLGVARPSLKE